MLAVFENNPLPDLPTGLVEEQRDCFVVLPTMIKDAEVANGVDAVEGVLVQQHA